MTTEKKIKSTIKEISKFNSMKRQFTFQIANSTGADKTIAINPAHYDTEAQVVTQSGETPFAVSSVSRVFTDATDIVSAGFSNVDYALDDGTIATNLTATSLQANNQKIRDFLRFIKSKMIGISKIEMEADDDSFFSQIIEVTRIWPDAKEGTKAIRIKEGKDRYQNADTTSVLEFDSPLEFSNQTLWAVKIPNGRTVDFTIEFEVAG